MATFDPERMRFSDHGRALRCLAWLAQCDGGGGAKGARDIDPRALRVIDLSICVDAELDDCPSEEAEEEVPMLGLVNLLAALFDEQHPLIATTTSTTRRRWSSQMTALSLLVILVRRLKYTDDIKADGVDDDDLCDGDEAMAPQQASHQHEQRSKVTQVLLALGNRLSPQALGKHEWIWRPCEAELRRFLPANSMMLSAMLPPSSSFS
jgi:hypothetical protein